MEKIKSLLDDEKMKKKLAKMSPKERTKVEQNIIEGERFMEKERRKEEALMRLPKENRLKEIYGKHLKMAFDEGIDLVRSLMEGRIRGREVFIFLQKHSKNRLRVALTEDLKKFGVLPLVG